MLLRIVCLALLTSSCDSCDAPQTVVDDTVTPASDPPPPALTIERTDPPAAAGAFAPSPTIVDGRIVATWIEPRDDGHAVRFAKLDGGAWSEAVTIVDSERMFANWADFPAVAHAADGSLIAHWARRSGESTYAYVVELVRSTDGGETWQPLGTAHDDESPTEHGFVSYVPEGAGVRAFWLDGRETANDGPTAVRTARVTDAARGEEVIDHRVCDCCQTAAAVTAHGPIVAYRDRSSDEIRDIAIVRRTRSGWSEPVRVHEDDWEIEGCPVNGPALSADGAHVALAWYTLGGSGGVFVAQSTDSAASFGEPAAIDTSDALGRVDVAVVDGGAVVTWLARLDDERAALRARFVSLRGEAATPVDIAEVSASRDSGFPRLEVLSDSLFVMFTEPADEGSGHVRALSFPQSELPRDVAVQPAADVEADDSERDISDLAGTALPDLDGRPSRLLDGTSPVVLAFFAMWCEPCREELPILSALADSHPDVRFIAVSIDDVPVDELRPLVGALAPSVTVLLDEPSIAARFAVPPLPATFVFDPGGRVVLELRGGGADYRPRLESAIENAAHSRHH